KAGIQASSTSQFDFASTTALTVSGALYTPVTSSLLKTDVSGKVTAAVAGVDYQAAGNYATFGYLFPNNATSTLIGFNGGLTAYASSTIGNGNQNGGLTINGGATTTGTAFIGGNLGLGTSSPFGKVSIALNAGNTTGTAFVIASSTGNSTTTLFSISNTGLINGLSLNLSQGATTSALAVVGSSTVSGIFNSTFANFLSSTTLSGNTLLANATTSSFAITSLPSTILKTDVFGNVVPAILGVDYQNFGYLFPSNATSTQIGFNGGATFVGATTTALAVNGSTTITTNLNVGGTIQANTLNLTNALGVAFGGTGSTTLGGLLTGNGTGAVTAAGVSSPLSFSGNTLSIAQATTGTNGYLSAIDFTTFNNKISSTSLSATYPLAYNSGTGNFSLGFGTTTSNTWAGTQTFTNAPVLGSLTGLVGSNNGTLYQIATSSNFVTSLAAGNGIALSGSTGNITVTNTIGYAFPSNATSTQIAFNGGLTATNATTTNATTTSFAISNLGSGSLLKTTTGGSITVAIAGVDYLTPAGASSTVAAAFPFTPTTFGSSNANATSTLIGFNAGLYALASSTFLSTVTLSSLANSVLAVNGQGQIIGTSSIGANNLTGILSVANGGTGSSTLSGILIGNGTSPVNTLTVGSGLSLSGTTLSNAIGYAFPGNATSTALTFNGGITVTGNTTLANATSTGFAITSLTNTLLKTDTSGNVLGAIAGTDYTTPVGVATSIANAYPFQLTGNATSTLTQFNAGLTAYASSTIGNGTQTGGLTISGGATTTGNSYFANKVGIGLQPSSSYSLITSGSINAGGNFVGSTALLGTGSASSPSYSFNADSGFDTGIFRPAENTLGFTTGGNEAARFGANGFLGIGTTSPYANLSIVATSTAPGNTLFAIASTTGSNSSALFVVDNKGQVGIGTNVAQGFSVTATQGIQTTGVIYAGAGTPAAPGFGFTSDAGSGLFNPADGTLGLVANHAERARITSTGFGIGTTSPSQALSVAGNALLSGNITVTNINGLGTLSVVGNTALANATTTSFAITTIANGLLSTNANGSVVATSSVSVNYLTGTLGVANGGTGSTTLGGLLTGNGTGSVTAAAVTGPLNFSGNTLSIAQATTGTAGYLSATDFATFNNKISSTSLSSANGYLTYNSTTGVFTASTSPTYTTATSTTLFTNNLTIASLTGILKATNGAVTTATAGTDYQAPLAFTYPLINTANTISLGFGTTTSNTWGGTQTFTNTPILGSLTGLVGSNNGTLYNIATSSNFVTALTAGNGIALSGSTGNVTVTNTIGYAFPSNATSTSIAFNGGLTASTLTVSTSASLASTTLTGSSLFTNATTTSFAISNIASGNLLKTTTGGSITAAIAGTDYVTPAGLSTSIGAAYPFQGAGNST
ncbi:MAG TPA: hypothetical protein VIY48_10380, partial [Candidatus Paceibacterota bacterium]